MYINGTDSRSDKAKVVSSILTMATILLLLVAACGPATNQSFFNDKYGNRCMYVSTYSGQDNGVYCKIDVEGYKVE